MSLIFYLRFRRFRKNGRFVADINFPPDQFPPLGILCNTLYDFCIFAVRRYIALILNIGKNLQRALPPIISAKKILDLQKYSISFRRIECPNSDFLSYFRTNLINKTCEFGLLKKLTRNLKVVERRRKNSRNIRQIVK